MPQRDYLSFERTPRSEEVQEDPPKQIEKLEHPAFFARFGRSGQADGICGRDSLFFVQLYRWFPSIIGVLQIIRPETLIRWHRAGFRSYWRWRSRNRGGRPRSD